MKKLLLALCLAAGAAHAEDVLHVYNWNNYIAPETVKRFEAECKCKVVQDYYGAMEEMLAKLTAGAKGYDIVVPTGFAIPPLVKQNLVQPLDKSKLPNFKNVNASFQNPWYDQGNKVSVPYAFTTTLVGYNDKKIKELGIDPSDWSIIFDPKVLEKVKGKVTVLDDSREVFAAALMYNGYSANSTKREEWKKAADTIKTAKKYWAAFNGQSYIKELTLGNIWIAHGYSNDMFQANSDAHAAKRPFGIAFGLQKQGNTLSVDNMMVLKNAPRPDLAHKFINFMLDGKNSADLTNMIGSGNPNAAAAKFVQPDIQKISAVFPDAAAMKGLQQLNALEGKDLRDLNKLWTEVKTAK
ncbi:spermidine/putrescine transport system substrate-binding protein [Andreprevotia lacus DSM 23236]|uniref:Putrescine-binding periplasmic protein n=1 Tax=Andreprevotia lacus DSM 23236 TaxID=1121001 RepID=A0A1W1X1I2_9NEIS|nr:spermidine/putrescine ABC transporter substrate-binding protein [Andreprevotia lacus]SMC17826.1 spermidine/putrescine transport system substrate-binding protein [Andreprevotia lacus DSM 23236]